MSSDRKRHAINKLRLDIEQDERGRKQRKISTFLTQLGIKRKTQKAICEVDQLLDEAGIIVSTGDEEVAWRDANVKSRINFRLNPSRQQQTSLNSESIDCIAGQAIIPSEPRSRESDQAKPMTRYDKNVSKISPGQGENPFALFLHQRKAIETLDTALLSRRKRKEFAGLIVIPTGGGKTRMAVHWILRNVIDKGGKVLWIAHRHELLEQARVAFEKNSYEDVLRERSEFNCRIISGQHDQAVEIRPADDVLIASVHSIRPGSPGEQHLVGKWLKKHDNVFLVIDEAHHAPARTYRHLISLVRRYSSPFRMLGLTATPFRTAKNEQGQLKKVFPDDIVYRVGLNQLIARNILSKPIFRTPQTKVNLQDELTEKDMRKLRRNNFNLNMLDETAQRKLAENRKRNRFIVDHYLDNPEEYGPTLVFALNVLNAIALNHLFQQAGVKAEYVVGNIQDMKRARNISPQENRKAIERFRSGETKVLINVNILTEGTDLPNVKASSLLAPLSQRR